MRKIKNTKRSKIINSTFAIAALTMILICSCSTHPHYETSSEALKGCNQELKKLGSKESCSIKQLTTYTKEWLEIQDSAYSTFARDSALGLHSPIATAYFMVSDSIRDQLTRLALSKQRTLKEVMYLKLNAVKDKEKITSSKTYKEYTSFFESLDKEDLYPNITMTVAAYSELLNNNHTLKNEKEITEYIKKEDKCFRSLMTYLSQVSQEQLNLFTKKTNLIFDKLYSVVGKHSDDMNDRIMLLLTMRFNRRIIQNCIACRNDIFDNRTLNRIQKVNYRWMLIQPFLTIDNFSAAVMTKEQQDKLLKVSEELPELISRIDDKSGNNNPVMLSKVLSEYFLKTYLNNL